MKKEVREYLKDEFHLLYRRSLKVDGHKIDIVKQMKSPTQSVYMMYIDDMFQGKHTSIDSEIGAKFYRPQYFRPKKNILDASIRLAKLRLKGKELKAEIEKLKTPKLIGYYPYFPSVASIIKQLKKCDSIEIIAKELSV